MSGCFRFDCPDTPEYADMDVPGNSWALAIPKDEDKRAVALLTKSKYGFRGYKNSLSLDLIRSSYDPDPYPESGVSNITFAVCLVGADDDVGMIQRSIEYNHPISFVSGKREKGELALAGSFLNVIKGDAIISTIKKPESEGQNQLIIRLYEVKGNKQEMEFEFINEVGAGWLVDLNEKRLEGKIIIENRIIKTTIEPFSVTSICVEF